jgi:hypothetical protein
MRLLLSVAVIAAVALPPMVGAQCPTPGYCDNYYNCTFIAFPTSSLFAEQVYNLAPPGYPPLYQQIAAVRGDPTRGTASAGASASCYGELEAYVGGMGILMDDEFELVGPASGAPVSFTAILHVTGYTQAGFYYSYAARTDLCGDSGIKCAFGDEVAPITREWRRGPGCSGSYVDEDLSVPRTAQPGVPFRLKHVLLAGAFCGSYTGFGCAISSRLRFEQLPAGYSIRSCLGYTADTGTPARRSSWAALKAHYR